MLHEFGRVTALSSLQAGLVLVDEVTRTLASQLSWRGIHEINLSRSISYAALPCGSTPTGLPLERYPEHPILLN